jgi:hypothetical protein
VLLVNSILAVAIGCSFYVFRYLYIRFYKTRMRRKAALAAAPAFEETLTTTGR